MSQNNTDVSLKPLLSSPNNIQLLVDYLDSLANKFDAQITELSRRALFGRGDESQELRDTAISVRGKMLMLQELSATLKNLSFTEGKK